MSSVTATLPTRFRHASLARHPEWIDAYREHGYVIIEGVFSPTEIASCARRCDRWYAEGLRHPATVRHQNKVIWVEDQPAPVGRIVRGMQWPSYEDEVLDAVRTDPRLSGIVEPLLGCDIKQIINQLHWKAPNSGVTWGLHQDVRSRKPDHAFRNLLTSYVQTGLAIDRHWAGNGAMQILPGSHRLGDRHINEHIIGHVDTGVSAWKAFGIDLAGLIDVVLEPGDIALWTPFTIHGGGVNTTSDNWRRLYINGYVRAEDCDRGEWAWRGGVPQALGEPQLIQFEELRSRPDVHYPGRGDLSTKISD